MRFGILPLFLAFLITETSCGQKNKQESQMNTMADQTMENKNLAPGLALATFGSGCFWCTEAIFQNIDGVIKAESGYSGGTVKNPDYKSVCTGQTGHAEVIQITYDTAKVSFEELLEIFWQTHDPTTLNRQGADEGTQYRSAIFYHTEQQKQLATEYKAKLNQSEAFIDPIVTEITPYSVFYKAEDYHQNYFNLNGSAPYCSVVIKPKVDKFKKVFKDKLKH